MESQMTQAILSKKNQIAGLIVLDFEAFYKARVIKAA